jgi:hypothetical protein
MIESLLLTATRVITFQQQRQLTNASGFFFERDGHLFLVTSKHVMLDEPSRHQPDRIEIELHIDPENMVQSTTFSIPLYRKGKRLWRQGTDSAGGIDVAVIEIERAVLPESVVYRAFTPEHLYTLTDRIEVGTRLVVVGFPLGFHDTLHHMPVARRAAVARRSACAFRARVISSPMRAPIAAPAVRRW